MIFKKLGTLFAIKIVYQSLTKLNLHLWKLRKKSITTLKEK